MRLVVDKRTTIEFCSDAAEQINCCLLLCTIYNIPYISGKKYADTELRVSIEEGKSFPPGSVFELIPSQPIAGDPYFIGPIQQQ
jgi:hypothetical protein